MSSVKKEPADIFFDGSEFMEGEKGKDFSDGAEDVEWQNEFLF